MGQARESCVDFAVAGVGDAHGHAVFDNCAACDGKTSFFEELSEFLVAVGGTFVFAVDKFFELCLDRT